MTSRGVSVYMEKHENHSVDERAKVILKDSLPPESWQIYDISPDYGKDFPVELVESGRQTGVTFLVQLKGTRTLTPNRDGSVSFRLKSTHAAYFTSLRQPIFLVLVDVTKKTGYWLFLQRHLTELGEGVWNRPGKVTLRLPASNQLTELIALRKEVHDAFAYMVETHPAAVENAIKADVRRLEALDPRFRIDLRATRDNREYTVHAQEPVCGTFTLKGDPNIVNQKAKDLFDRGMPVELAPDEIEATGSPLMEHLIKFTRRIQAAWTIEGTLSFKAINASGREVGAIPAIPCRFQGGRSEFAVRAVFPHELGSFSQSFKIAAGPIGMCKLGFDFNKWKGQPLLGLPLFQSIASVFCERRVGDIVQLEFCKPAERLFDLTYSVAKGSFENSMSWLDILRKARKVAECLGSNPVLPVDFNLEDVRDIQCLYDILVDGIHTEDGSGFVIGAVTGRREAERFLSAPVPWTGARFQGQFKLVADFLREKHTFDSIEFCLTEADAESSRALVLKQMADVELDAFNMDWCGTPTSLFTYSLPGRLPTSAA